MAPNTAKMTLGDPIEATVKVPAVQETLNKKTSQLASAKCDVALSVEAIKADIEYDSRRTKIVCTLGPACWEVPQLEVMIKAGMSIARFNFSHGSHEGHLQTLNRLREASKNCKKDIGKYYVANLVSRFLHAVSVFSQNYFRCSSYCSTPVTLVNGVTCYN
jgi:hypothetical protein